MSTVKAVNVLKKNFTNQVMEKLLDDVSCFYIDSNKFSDH